MSNIKDELKSIQANVDKDIKFYKGLLKEVEQVEKEIKELKEGK